MKYITFGGMWIGTNYKTCDKLLIKNIKGAFIAYCRSMHSACNKLYYR